MTHPEAVATDTIPDEVAAVHEAAHVVVAHVFGVPSEYATIRPEGEMRGHAKWLGPKRELPDHPARFAFLMDCELRADLERCAIAVLAGGEAVKLAFPRSGYGPGTNRGLGPDWTLDVQREREESHHDDDRADKLAALLAGSEAGAYRAWLSAVARRICRDEAPAIQRVAAALVERGRVEGADLYDLVVGPNAGPVSERRH